MYMQTKWGDCLATQEQFGKELEALGSVVAAEEQSYNLWTICWETARKVTAIVESLQTLDRVLTTWVGRFDEVMNALYHYMHRDDLSEVKALQLASIKCRCPDLNCDFPFTIDARHRHL
ncbi:hypothetical protein KC19_VG054600 [Ceratodon purpureus]|uniref:Uncharacterized protein n=1 Tax=Ceratodon purpureus TaxID=3225 RepID=A0A8T0HM76_CERPU|nr:hypothetical protein KC19_VG054600 [Ceratodon purpureus]